MKYFVMSMFALWILLTLVFAVKEYLNEKNTDSDR